MKGCVCCLLCGRGEESQLFVTSQTYLKSHANPPCSRISPPLKVQDRILALARGKNRAGQAQRQAFLKQFPRASAGIRTRTFKVLRVPLRAVFAAHAQEEVPQVSKKVV